jgi:hypothetical protein
MATTPSAGDGQMNLPRLATPATDMATGDGRLMLFAAVLDRFIVHSSERV